MENPLETQVPIHDLIRRRRSPRAFSKQPVEPDKLLSLMEAARWAPSSRNEQPWAYLLATRSEPENYEALAGVLVDSNREWAANAPVLILTMAHTRLEKDGQPNRHAYHDLGQATASLIFQATSLGLVAHQMGGFRSDAAKERFHLPEGWDPVSVIALGYQADAESLPESLRERETAQRRRKPLKEFVFSGTWGRAAPILGATEKK